MSKITNKFLAQAPADTLKGNNTGATANVTDLTVAQVQAMLSIPTSSSPLAVNAGGTGESSLTAHAVLVGAGTSAITLVSSSTQGTVLQGEGSSIDPTFTANPTLGVGSSVQGSIALANATNNNLITISPTTATSNYSFILPAGPGSAGQFLTSQAGSSAMTWTSGLTLANLRAGVVAVSSGVSSKVVTFSSTIGTTSYAVVAVMLNTTDSNTQFQPITVTAQSATGFTATWNGLTATANYSIMYIATVNN